MNTGHKHSSRWGFNEILYHKMTSERGMVNGIILRYQSQPMYAMVFQSDVNEKNCYEAELQEEQPTSVTNEKTD